MITLVRMGASFFNDETYSQTLVLFARDGDVSLSSLILPAKTSIQLKDILEWFRIRGIIIDMNHYSGYIKFSSNNNNKITSIRFLLPEISRWFGLDTSEIIVNNYSFLSDNTGNSRLLAENESKGIYLVKSFYSRKKEKGTLSVKGIAYNGKKADLPKIEQYEINGYDVDDLPFAIDFIENCSNDECSVLGLGSKYPTVRVMGDGAYLSDGYSSTSGKLIVKVADYISDKLTLVKKMSESSVEISNASDYIKIGYVYDSSNSELLLLSKRSSTTGSASFINEEREVESTHIHLYLTVFDTLNIDGSCFCLSEKTLFNYNYLKNRFAKTPFTTSIDDGIIIGVKDSNKTEVDIAVQINNNVFVAEYEKGTSSADPTEIKSYANFKLLKGAYIDDDYIYLALKYRDSESSYIKRINKTDWSINPSTLISPCVIDSSYNQTGHDGLLAFRMNDRFVVSNIKNINGNLGTSQVEELPALSEINSFKYRITSIDDYNSIIVRQDNNKLYVYHLVLDNRVYSSYEIDVIDIDEEITDFALDYFNYRSNSFTGINLAVLLPRKSNGKSTVKLFLYSVEV